MRTDEHTTPPWRGFIGDRKPIVLPTSRTCQNKAPGCLVAKAHGLLNDTEACLREAMNQMEPNSDQEMADLVLIKDLADELLRSERRMRDILLRNGTDCPEAERCRCL